MGTNGKESLIVLDGVTKVFVTDEVETHALSGIQLDLKKGEYLSIAGPSGCGKSTLLAILGLLDTPSDGTYTLNSRPVSGLKLSERARIRNREIGFIFQAFNPVSYTHLDVYKRQFQMIESKARAGGAGAGGHVAPHEALSVAALGRSAAARGGGQGAGRRSSHPTGG